VNIPDLRQQRLRHPSRSRIFISWNPGIAAIALAHFLILLQFSIRRISDSNANRCICAKPSTLPLSSTRQQRWNIDAECFRRLQVNQEQGRPKPAIRLSRKDWLLRADRAVLCTVPGAGCASGSCPAGCFAEVGLQWWRRWSPHNRRRSR
jgi:hypothetical protein